MSTIYQTAFVNPIDEKCVIYESAESVGLWVAHGVRTCQIGTGQNPQTALANFIKAIYVVSTLSVSEYNVFRNAPDRIHNYLTEAIPLPNNIRQKAMIAAHQKRVNGARLTRRVSRSIKTSVPA